MLDAPALTNWKLGEVARSAIEKAERLVFDRKAGLATGLAPTHIAEVLTNPFYAGRLRTGEPSALGPLVDDGTWEHVQAMRARYSRRHPESVNRRGPPTTSSGRTARPGGSPRARPTGRRPKADPAGRGAPGHFRLRYDIADKKGAITLRRAGRPYHLKVGAAFAHRCVLAFVDEVAVTVGALDAGEVLSTHRIEPDKGYWRNRRRDPSRWPGSQATGGPEWLGVPTHVTHVSRLMTWLTRKDSNLQSHDPELRAMPRMPSRTIGHDGTGHAVASSKS